MTPKIVQVKLSNTDLDVQDGGGLKFYAAKGLRRIEFRLDAASALVWSTTLGKPAFFIAKSTTPQNPLSPPQVIDDGKTLVVNNAHFNVSTVGEIVYVLTAAKPDPSQTDGYRYYQTTVSNPDAPRKAGVRTIDNPVIINKREGG